MTLLRGTARKPCRAAAYFLTKVGASVQHIVMRVRR
jgi:hypothetical protein